MLIKNINLVRSQGLGDSVPYYEKELAQIVAELNRAARCRGTPRKRRRRRTPGNLDSLDQLLIYAVQQTASDLLLIAGAPVTLRIGGELSKPGGAPLGGRGHP